MLSLLLGATKMIRLPTVEANLLRMWRESKGLTQFQVGAKCPQLVTARGIGEFERRTHSSISITNLMNLVRGLEVPGASDAERISNFFRGPHVPPPPDSMAGVAVGEAEARHITTGGAPLLQLARRAAQIGAGPGYVDELDDPKQYAFSRDWIERAIGKSAANDEKRLAVFKVAKTFGDSMEPRIQSGDSLLADMGPRGEGHRRVVDGKIYILRTPGEGGLQVKRIAVKRGQMVIWGDNRAYDPETLALEGHELQKIVVGRVRLISHEEE